MKEEHSGYQKYGRAIVNLLVAGICLLLFIYLVPKLLVFFMPFVVGWIIACIANPLVRFFETKLNIRRKAGTAFVIITVIAMIALGGYLAGSKLWEEFMGLINSLPEIWDGFEADFRSIGQKWDIFYNELPYDVQNSLINIGQQVDKYMSKIVETIGTPTVNAVGNIAKNLPAAVISVIMTLLSAYFFTTDREYIHKWIAKNISVSFREKCAIITGSMKSAVGGYFKAQFKIEIWIYLILVVGLLFLKVDYALLIALGMAFLDLLPFFGTGIVIAPWAVFKFLAGDYIMTIGLLIIWGISQLVRQIIQPKFVGDSIGMPPIPTLFLLFIGYKTAGVIGMIIAVPIGIIVVQLNESGAFDNVVQSLKILINGINRFRKLRDDEKL